MKIRFSSAFAFVYASVVGICFGNVAISSVGNKTFVSSNSNVLEIITLLLSMVRPSLRLEKLSSPILNLFFVLRLLSVVNESLCQNS